MNIAERLAKEFKESKVKANLSKVMPRRTLVGLDVDRGKGAAVPIDEAKGAFLISKPKPKRAHCAYCSNRATKTCSNPKCNKAMCDKHAVVEGPWACCRDHVQTFGSAL